MHGSRREGGVVCVNIGAIDRAARGAGHFEVQLLAHLVPERVKRPRVWLGINEAGTQATQAISNGDGLIELARLGVVVLHSLQRLDVAVFARPQLLLVSLADSLEFLLHFGDERFGIAGEFISPGWGWEQARREDRQAADR
jgi:hypothetical protein